MFLRQPYPPAHRGRVVVWGLLASLPVGGMIWQVFHNLVPLRKLGFDVWYVEDSDRSLYDMVTYSPTQKFEEYKTNLSRLARFMTAIGMGDRWVFRLPGTNKVLGALDADGLERLYGKAVAGINLCGAQELDERHLQIPCRIYLETDPVTMQVLVAKGDHRAIQILDKHNHHFTYGAQFGSTDCRVPLDRYDWQTTVPPVCLEFWDDVPAPPCGAPLSTVLNWKHKGKDVEWDGEMWRWTKDQQFRRFIDLPARSPLPLELCLGGASDSEREEIARHGWGLKNSTDYVEPEAYRDYITQSLGEFSAAKELVVLSRSGWVSDRTVCYLAAGRPAVVQDTGIGNFLPIGDGLFTFSTDEEALDAIERIAKDYSHHAAAARELAHEYFDADRVVGKVVESVGLI